MKKIFLRIIAIAPAIILQLLFYYFLLIKFKQLFVYFSYALGILSFFIVLNIISYKNEPSYKLLWLLIILISPIIGSYLYLFYGDSKTSRKIVKRIDKEIEDLDFELIRNKQIHEDLKNDDEAIYNILSHVELDANTTINYNNASTKYFEIGEKMHEDMLIELEKAKEFIFLEYFIIEKGKFLDTIVDILKRKAKEGLDVRILFDDLGSISTYSYVSVFELNKAGIKCFPFNPFKNIKASLNNRDHRKMMIIDNRVAYSGGVNIADEYINEKKRFNHWKDIGFKVEGDEVYTFTSMFISFYNASVTNENKIDAKYLNVKYEGKDEKEGYVLSYTDYPTFKSHISHDLFINLLFNAKNYIYFFTPYLIIGENMIYALCQAAKRGVDVRIILPGVPDKKVIYRMSRSYYYDLLEAGVKIYEYTPGFLHGKATVVDDVVATIGTVNLDYRSLFLHFENNTIFYKAKIIEDIKKDMLDTMKISRRVHFNNIKKTVLTRTVDGLLRIFAPLC